jgi:hypothetical protein
MTARIATLAPHPVAETHIPIETRAPLLCTPLLVAVLFWPARCLAQQAAPRASLVVTRGEGAEDCPDAASLAAQVQRLAGRSVIDAEPLSTPPRDTWIQVAIVRNFGGYLAEISAGGLHHGSRSLEDSGPSCSSLADAITITIAMFLDPYATTPLRRAEGRSTPVPAQPKATPQREPLRQPPPWRARLTLDLAAGASFGALAHTAPLVTARLAWRATERWSLGVGGAFLFPDSISAGTGSVDLGLSYGYLVGCARAVGEAEGVRLDWCAAAVLGSLYGQGHGYENTWTRHAPWTAIAAGPEIVLPFTTWLAWSLSGLAGLPVARPGFDIAVADKRSSAFRASPVTGLVALGVRGEL